MSTIEERAKDYAKQANAKFPEICAFDYMAGAKEEHILLTEWHDIETDKDGFATEEFLDELWNNRPVLVKDIQDNYYFIIQNEPDFVDWRADLCHKPQYFKWRKIHE